VIGINSAYIDGFAGGTLGVSVEALKPLLSHAQSRRRGSVAAADPDENTDASAGIPVDVASGNGTEE
jgi:hypothetical protein